MGPHAEVFLQLTYIAKFFSCREQSSHPGMEISDSFVIILDKFPKARIHGLVIARDLRLEGPADLTNSHLPLLDAMEVISCKNSILHLNLPARVGPDLFDDFYQMAKQAKHRKQKSTMSK